MAAKIRWLKRRAVGLDGARFHQPVSFLVERLTGESVFDHGLASTTMLYSLADRQFSPELCAAFGIDPGELPRIDDAVALAGRLTGDGATRCGLPVGTAVAVGTGDDFAAPLGAGILAPGPVACVIGTAEVVGAVADDPLLDPGGLVETHAYPGGRSFIENPGWLSGGAIAWLRPLLALVDDAAVDAEAAAVPAGSDGLLFLPALSGAMAPSWVASARGCFYGLTPAHGRGHLVRAVMEGCAFAMYDVVLRLREIGVATQTVRLLGGGARSRLWAQIRADLSGLPVEVAGRADSCPVGAAALAAVAAGIAGDLNVAISAGGRVAHIAEPGAGASALLDGHGRYRELFRALGPMFSR
jgi:xylulokinase